MSRLSGRVQALDSAVDRAFDHLRGRRRADRLFYSASALGDFSLLWHLTAAALALRSEREGLRLSVALGIESALVNGLVKSCFGRTRPLVEDAHPHQLRQPLSSSFPSGHASAGFLAATLLAEGRPRAAALAFGGASVVAASRIYVRIHHASDVLSGVAFGLGFGLLTRRIWPVQTRPFYPGAGP